MSKLFLQSRRMFCHVYVDLESLLVNVLKTTALAQVFVTDGKVVEVDTVVAAN